MEWWNSGISWWVLVPAPRPAAGLLPARSRLLVDVDLWWQKGGAEGICHHEAPRRDRELSSCLGAQTGGGRSSRPRAFLVTCLFFSRVVRR